MKTLTVLLTTLLAATNALTTRQTPKNHIRDHSFEQVTTPSNYRPARPPGTSGNWTLSGSLTTFRNVKNAGGINNTPYGNEYLVFFRMCKELCNQGHIIQPIRYLESGTYNFSFAYRTFDISQGYSNYTFTARLGNQVIDSVFFPYSNEHQNATWYIHSTTFRPEASYGPLVLNLSAPLGSPYWEFHLDRILLVGPY